MARLPSSVGIKNKKVVEYCTALPYDLYAVGGFSFLSLPLLLASASLGLRIGARRCQFLPQKRRARTSPPRRGRGKRNHVQALRKRAPRLLRRWIKADKKLNRKPDHIIFSPGRLRRTMKRGAHAPTWKTSWKINVQERPVALGAMRQCRHSSPRLTDVPRQL